MPTPGVQVDGADVLRRNLKRVDKDLPKGMKVIHLELSQPIAEIARGRAPTRTGRLAATVRAGASMKAAVISAGARLTPYPYGPVVHYGGYPGAFPGIPFLTDAMTDAAPTLAADYDTRLNAWLENVWETSR